MKGIIAFEKLSGLPDVLIDEAAVPDETEQKQTRKHERREARQAARQRLFSSPAFAACVSLIVAFGVVTAIVLAGRAAGRQPVDPAAHTGESKYMLITYYQWQLDGLDSEAASALSRGAYTDGLNTIAVDPTAWRAFVRDDGNLKPVKVMKRPDLEHIPGDDPWRLWSTVWLELDGEVWRVEQGTGEPYLVRARSMYGKGETYAPDEDGWSLLRELLFGHPNYRSRYRFDVASQQLYQEENMGMYGTYLYSGPDTMPDVDYPDIETKYVRVAYLFDLVCVDAAYDEGTNRLMGSVTVRLWAPEERYATVTASGTGMVTERRWQTVHLSPCDWQTVTLDFDVPAENAWGVPPSVTLTTGGQSYQIELTLPGAAVPEP